MEHILLEMKIYSIIVTLLKLMTKISMLIKLHLIFLDAFVAKNIL
jgi:hypothetical protein